MIIVIKFGCEREVVRSCRLDTRNMNPHFDLSIEDSFWLMIRLTMPS